jgi:hypothetical protein
LEGWSELTEFVEKTAKRPDITFEVVLLTGPNLGSSIVGGSGLGGCELSFHDFGDIEISVLGDSVDDEDIGGLDVSVDNFIFVHDFHTLE